MDGVDQMRNVLVRIDEDQGWIVDGVEESLSDFRLYIVELEVEFEAADVLMADIGALSSCR